MTDGHLGPLQPADGPREPVRPKSDAARKPHTTRHEASADRVGLSGMDIHNQDALRATAARLVAEGDIDTSVDGAVRPDRVDAVRRNLNNGTYNRRDVISGIVDRLLEQWRI
ncbi:MAG: hypothetical protein HY304_07255 [candidate division Zixibacteria bacterium]|nr:hypothetical protein [candidate division Zixibacteria bacterium]